MAVHVAGAVELSLNVSLDLGAGKALALLDEGGEAVKPCQKIFGIG